MPSSLRNQIIVAGTVLIFLSVILTVFLSLLIRINDPLSKVDRQFQIRSEILNTLSILVIKDGNWLRIDRAVENLSGKFSIRIVLASEEGSVVVDTMPDDKSDNLVGIGLIDPSNPLFNSTSEEIGQLEQITKLNRAMATCLKEAGIKYTLERNLSGIIRVFPVIRKDEDLAASRGCFFSMPSALVLEDGNRRKFPAPMAVYIGVDDQSYFKWIYLSGVGLLGVFVVFGSTFWFSRKIAKPLESLTTAAKKISEGDLSTRVSPQGSNEIDRFAASFDNMAKELADVAEKRRKFMSDISHEIRSPLTNIRSHISAIVDGMEKFSDRTLDSINSQIDQVSSLIDDLQQLSLADEGLLKIDKFPVVIEDIVDQISTANKPYLDEAGISLLVKGSAPEPVSIDPLRIRQILQNLISNASRYTAKGGFIEISLNQDMEVVEVSVRDTGTGISPYFLPHMFERFARDDQSRNRNTGGSGLGLSIALEIALAHGGSLSADNHSEGGAIFTLTLPAYKELIM
jgi:signal transduction histidine kinase